MPITKTDGVTISVTEEDDYREMMLINVLFPPVLEKKVSEKRETTINLLHVASIVYNNKLDAKPESGFGKLVFFLNSQKVERDYRIHSVCFDPTLDLEYTNMTATVSSVDNKELQTLIDGEVVSFYLSGKIIQKKNGDIESIVINKVTPKVDQTAYARRHQKVIVDENKNVRVIDPNDPYEIANIKSFKNKWNEFSSIKMEYEETKSEKMFKEWKKLTKGKTNTP
jgi:hypothetical protein